MVEMGMDLYEVKDFLENKCIHEENPQILLDHMTDPYYINTIKNGFAKQANIHAHLQAQGYNYMPDHQQ